MDPRSRQGRHGRASKLNWLPRSRQDTLADHGISILMKPPFDLDAAEKELARNDERLSEIIDRYRPCTWTLRSMESPFHALLRAIIFQQLSTTAANTIYGRVEALFNDRLPEPNAVLQLEEDTIRAAGVSRPKIRYLKDLAEKTLDGTVPTMNELKALDDKDILDRLCAIKGIGRWTVEMLLMFNLGRPDVLPSTDLVIRRGFKNIYGWDDLPSFKELEAYGEIWRPYRSLACWYIWRFEDGDNDAW